MVTRQKLGGTNFSFFILNQLPVFPPSAYAEHDCEYIAPRVLELTYTAWNVKPFGDDIWRSFKQGVRDWIGHVADDKLDVPEWVELSADRIPYPPCRWNEERRLRLRAELDAYYARLSRDDLRYILDPSEIFGNDFPGETFRLLKEREHSEFGEYRTRRLVLDAFDKLAESRAFATRCQAANLR